MIKMMGSKEVIHINRMLELSEVNDHFRKAEEYHRERIGTHENNLQTLAKLEYIENKGLRQAIYRSLAQPHSVELPVDIEDLVNLINEVLSDVLYDEDNNFDHPIFLELAQTKITPYIGDILHFMKFLEDSRLVDKWFGCGQNKDFSYCGCVDGAQKRFIHFHLTIKECHITDLVTINSERQVRVNPEFVLRCFMPNTDPLRHKISSHPTQSAFQSLISIEPPGLRLLLAFALKNWADVDEPYSNEQKHKLYEYITECLRKIDSGTSLGIPLYQQDEIYWLLSENGLVEAGCGDYRYDRCCDGGGFILTHSAYCWIEGDYLNEDLRSKW